MDVYTVVYCGFQFKDALQLTHFQVLQFWTYAFLEKAKKKKVEIIICFKHVPDFSMRE
jgi:hypothetical protein